MLCSKLSKLAIHLAWQSTSSLSVAMMTVYNLLYIFHSYSIYKGNLSYPICRLPWWSFVPLIWHMTCLLQSDQYRAVFKCFIRIGPIKSVWLTRFGLCTIGLTHRPLCVNRSLSSGKHLSTFEYWLYWTSIQTFTADCCLDLRGKINPVRSSDLIWHAKWKP